MKLLVDIGNSRAKFVCVKNKEMSEIQAINNDNISTVWLTEHYLAVSQVIVASVNQEQTTHFIQQWAKSLNKPCLVINTEKEKFGVINAYQDESSLGVDRWLALIGASKYLANKNVIIVDAGTATTIDIITDNKQHLGGWILPGVDLMFDSLLSNTEKIYADKIRLASITFGNNTTECVNNACWASIIGVITLARLQANQLRKPIDDIVVTGGNATEVELLLSALYQSESNQDFQVHLCQKLIFQGMSEFIKESE